MGSVYRARQVWLERDVAVKVLRAGTEVDSRARRRLHREARAVARIQNPHVVQVHDYGETADGAPFLVMELVPGPTADAWIRHGGRSLEEVLDALDGVLAGLAAAHARGVLHRDLKPANMLVRGGRPDQLVLVDFGIAAVIKTGLTSASRSAIRPVGGGTLPDSIEQVLQEERARSRQARQGEERITREGTVVGTPLYMAPEQALGHPVGPPADLYAAAVVLYEWLSGRPPFTGAVADVMRGHAYMQAPALRPRSGLGVPEALRLFVARGLAKDPHDRPESAGAMRSELRALRGAPRPRPAPGLPQTVELSPAQIEEASAPKPPIEVGGPPRLPVVLPFVGRIAERARLGQLLEDSRRGHGRIAILEGPSGVGTSRLAEEFSDRCEEDGQVWVGRGSAVSDALPHAAVRQAVEDLLEARALGGDGLRARLEVAIGPAASGGGLSTQERDALLGWLRPEAQADHATEWRVPLLERALRVLAGVRPVVLWLDAVDRAGPDGARVLEQLAAAQRLDPFPLLILATRTGEEADTDVWTTLSRQQGDVVYRIGLAPLPDADIADLAGQALPLTRVAAARIASRAGGSPLVAAHLLRHLLDSGRLVSVGGTLDLVEGDMLRDVLPGSLRDMMDARLSDAVAACADADGARAVLRVIAALGPAVPVDVLSDVLGAGIAGAPMDEAALDDLLDALIGAGALEEAGGRADDLVRLPHPLMVDTLVDGLLASRRGRRMARAMAEWVLGAPEPLRERFAAATVRLLQGCGASELLPEPALRAGRQALGAGNLGEARALLRSALEHAVGPTRETALELAARANQLLGHHDEAQEQLRALLDGAAGPALTARAQSALGRSLVALGRYADALPFLQAAAALHEQGLPDSACELARTASTLGRLADVVPDLEPPSLDGDALLAAVSTPHDRYVVAVSLGFLTTRAGDHADALRLLRIALGAARSANHRPGIVTTLFDLGWTERRAGDLDAAAAHLRECLTLAGALGRKPMLARVHNELGELRRVAGDLAAGRRHYEAAVALAAHVDGPEPLVAELNLAVLDTTDGRAEEARDRLMAMKRAERLPPWLAAPWELTLAYAEAALGAPELAGRLDRVIGALSRAPAAQPEAADLLDRIADACADSGAVVLSARAREAARGLR